MEKLKSPKTKLYGSLAIMFVLHLVGLLGLIGGYRNIILSLTSINLMICTFLVIWNVDIRNSVFKSWFLFVVAFGFLIEWLGVYSGLIFGNYTYGTVLGLRVFAVPVIIGLNWFLVSYGSFSLVSLTSLSRPLRVTLSALLCVGIDVLIEPVAIHLGYWNWNGPVPIHNYIGWFGTSIVIQAVGHYSRPMLKPSAVAMATFIIQVIFFAVLIILL